MCSTYRHYPVSPLPPTSGSAKVQLGLNSFLEEIRFQPDAIQRSVLESPGHRVLLNCCRQFGKSTIAAVQAVRRARSEPGSLTLVAAPSERQSAEFLRKSAEFLIRLGITPRGDGDHPLSLALPNGSRVIGLPGVEKTTRCFSAVSLLVIDEAARLPDFVYRALRPMLAVSNGDIWMMSTPYGKRGFFYESWAYGTGWSRFTARGNECGRISAEFLEEERREMGEQWFRQEYLCEFVDSGPGLFALDAVEKCLDASVDALHLG